MANIDWQFGVGLFHVWYLDHTSVCLRLRPHRVVSQETSLTVSAPATVTIVLNKYKMYSLWKNTTVSCYFHLRNWHWGHFRGYKSTNSRFASTFLSTIMYFSSKKNWRWANTLKNTRENGSKANKICLIFMI